MFEEKYFELCTVRFIDVFKLSAELSKNSMLIDNDDKNTEDKICKILKENMPSINCEENTSIIIFCDYIFSDSQVFVYAQNSAETISGLISIKYFASYRAVISDMEAPKELLTWFDAVIENVCEKNGIKLDLH